MKMLPSLNIMLNNGSNESTAELFVKDLPDESYIIAAVYLILVGCMALTANIFVITVLLKGNICYHDIHLKLLINIVVSDILVTLIAIPLSTASSMSKRWIFGKTGCNIAGYSVFLFCLNEMNTHAAIAILRYIIVCKPEYEHYLKRKWSSFYFFLPVWGHALFFTTLPFLGMRGYTTEAFGISCSIDWANNSAANISCNIIIILGCYFLHVSIFVFCYTKVIRKFADASKVIVRLKGEILTDAQTLQLEVMLRHHKVLTYRKVALASLAMVAVFVIAWTPYALTSICFMFTQNLPAWVEIIPTMMAKSSVVLSPLACALFSCAFRKAARHLVFRTTDDMNNIPEVTDLQTNRELRR